MIRGLPSIPSEVFTRSSPQRDDAVKLYRETGVVVLADLLSEEEVEVLRRETVRVCRGELGEIKGGYERPADGETDSEVLRRVLCVHMPHKISAVFASAMQAPRAVAALTSVIGPNVKAMQSMVFVKSAGKPGQAWHQDEYFIPTRDRSLTAVWIALDDATVENGCLWALPGSHRAGVVYPDREHADPRFDCSIEAFEFPYRDEDALPLEVTAGSAVMFNGYLLHRSLPNGRPGSTRRALVNHYMSAESLLPWRLPPEGVHMAKADYRDIVLVAGSDPYAWKGTEDIARPHVRPDRDGGCDR